MEQTHARTFDRLIDVEAKLIYNLTASRNSYSSKSYLATKGLIDKMIEESNKPSYLHKYTELTKDTIRNLSSTVQDQLSKYTKDLHEESIDTINKIDRILK
jgi:hypothetical protein